MIGERCGERPDVRTCDWRAGDQRYYVSDTSAFAARTGWAPRVDPAAGIAALHGWLTRATLVGHGRRLMSTATATMRSAVIQRAGRWRSSSRPARARARRGPRRDRGLRRLRLRPAGVGGPAVVRLSARAGRTRPRGLGDGRCRRRGGHRAGGRRTRGDPRLPLLCRVRRGGRRRAVVLPSALDDQPFPGEPLGCAINAFQRAGVSAGDTVAVVGIGFLGALLVAACGLGGRSGDRGLAPPDRAAGGRTHGRHRHGDARRPAPRRASTS